MQWNADSGEDTGVCSLAKNTNKQGDTRESKTREDRDITAEKWRVTAVTRTLRAGVNLTQVRWLLREKEEVHEETCDKNCIGYDSKCFICHCSIQKQMM